MTGVDLHRIENRKNQSPTDLKNEKKTVNLDVVELIGEGVPSSRGATSSFMF